MIPTNLIPHQHNALQNKNPTTNSTTTTSSSFLHRTAPNHKRSRKALLVSVMILVLVLSTTFFFIRGNYMILKLATTSTTSTSCETKINELKTSTRLDNYDDSELLEDVVDTTSIPSKEVLSTDTILELNDTQNNINILPTTTNYDDDDDDDSNKILPENIEDGIPYLFQSMNKLPPFPQIMDQYFNNDDMQLLIQGDRTKRETYLALLSLYGPFRKLPPLRTLQDPNPVDISNLDTFCTQTWNQNKMYGKRQPHPAKVVIFVTVAYDLDALEFLFYETFDHVDTYVIFENHLAHHNLKSHAFFAASKSRFYKFMSKVLYFMDDDRDMAKFYKTGNEKIIHDIDWQLETRMRVKILEYYKQATADDPDDLSNTWYFAGDPDEIPSKHLVARTKYCYLSPDDSVKLFARKECMYRNNLEHILNGYEGWDMATLSMVDDIMKVPFRSGGRTSNVLHYSGMHLNRCTDPYTDVMKELTMSEGGNLPTSVSGQSPEMLWKNPEMNLNWRQYGFRTCCTKFDSWQSVEAVQRTQKEKKLTVVAGKHPMEQCAIPWIALYNKHRWPEMFPSVFPGAIVPDD